MATAADASFRPPLEVKRAQIVQARDGFRQRGFAAELDIEALRVQDAGDGESIAAEIAKLEHTRDNAYKAARRMEEMLTKLPKPKAEKSS